ncbi:MAG: hypothetical protein [Anelloviridae sp.]|nr:MAG: hypothetical protein [Anelloviridae sp.]
MDDIHSDWARGITWLVTIFGGCLLSPSDAAFCFLLLYRSWDCMLHPGMLQGIVWTSEDLGIWSCIFLCGIPVLLCLPCHRWNVNYSKRLLSYPRTTDWLCSLCP